MTRSSSPRNAVLAALLSCGLAGTAATNDAFAQQPSQLVDGIIAVVGDTIVTFSEMQEYLIRLQASGMRIPEDPAQKEIFIRQALEQKINSVLLVIHAERDGIIISDDEIEQTVEQQLGQIRRQFASEAEFHQALLAQGITPAEFRMRVSEQARTDLLGQRYLQTHVSQLQPVPVSEDEIVQLYEAQKSMLGSKPATVTLQQVVIAVQPTEDARLLAEQKAEEALSRAQAGEDFARLAREYSDDAASRAQGGQLGWVSQGALLPEFEDVLFSLRAGQVSDIVVTSIGLHIIKLDRIRGSERQASHILIIPEITEADHERARQLADSIAEVVRDGADIDSLIYRFGDPNELSSLTDYPQERLPEIYKAAIRGATTGDIVGPFELAVPGLPGKWVVAMLTGVSPGGEWSLDDVRERFRLQIQQEAMIQKVVNRLREETYVEERLDDYLALFQ
jgi:peptidyl-prolyl cis-trans isomerase SurA